MKNGIFIFSIVMVVTLFTGCEKDRSIRQKVITISADIKGIVAEGAWEIHIYRNDNTSAYIEYSAFVENRITTEIKNGKLYLKFRNRPGATRKDLIATINIPEIELMELDGACKATLNGNFQNEKCVLKLSGASSSYMLSMCTQAMEVDLSGSSDAEICVEEVIIGSLSGASTLKYRGDADISGVKTNGASRIKQIQ